MFKKYIFVLVVILTINCLIISAFKTENWILEREYPLERHRIQTEDGYILTKPYACKTHRIPHSPLNSPYPPFESSAKQRPKPVILLQHGFALSSEVWVLPDREFALAYLLADAGFDVWLGNQRGNSYSRRHIELNPKTNDFWNFSFHEIGYYDLPGMIDYILVKTNNTAIHYVGYSQGSTVLLVLLASRPEYRNKVKSSHLLAPVAFMDNMKQPMVQMSGLVLGLGELALDYIGHDEILRYHHWPFYKELCNFVCGEDTIFRYACRMVFRFIGGPGMTGIKQNVLSDICAAHPAGASLKQILHFIQVYVKGKFQQYDYGPELNEVHYKQPTPPSYNISGITNCVHLYYGLTDHLSDMLDVEKLAQNLPCAVLQPIKDDDNNWNHYDFLWSQDAKQLINEHIIRVVKETEMKMDVF